MNSDKNTSERFEFVGELLNGEELLERLAAAQDVVKSLQGKIDLLQRFHDRAVEDSLARDKGEAAFYEFTALLATDLAQAGGYAHKEKNEVILSVIHSLLTRRIYWHPRRHYDVSQGMDDLPF